jgi:hypothetical protein
MAGKQLRRETAVCRPAVKMHKLKGRGKYKRKATTKSHTFVSVVDPE